MISPRGPASQVEGGSLHHITLTAPLLLPCGDCLLLRALASRPPRAETLQPLWGASVASPLSAPQTPELAAHDLKAKGDLRDTPGGTPFFPAKISCWTLPFRQAGRIPGRLTHLLCAANGDRWRLPCLSVASLFFESGHLPMCLPLGLVRLRCNLGGLCVISWDCVCPASPKGLLCTGV